MIIDVSSYYLQAARLRHNKHIRFQMEINCFITNAPHFQSGKFQQRPPFPFLRTTRILPLTWISIDVIIDNYKVFDRHEV